MTHSLQALSIDQRNKTGTAGSERWHGRLVLFAMCLAAFMIQLDVTIVNIALPTLQRNLALGPSSLEWVISGYALSLAAFIPLAGALGDRFGHRLVVTDGLILFGLGSLGCALADSSAVLLTARAVQGVGGAAILALTLAILNRTFPPAERSRVIGAWAALGGIGFGAGPVVGGILLAFFGGASVFWVNLLITLIASAMAFVTVPPGPHGTDRRALDLIGVLLASGGLTAITLGLIDSTSHSWIALSTALPLCGGSALLILFLIWQGRAAHPLVPASLLRTRSFLAACGAYFASYTAFSGTLYYVTLLFQNVKQWSALETGLTWLLMNVPFLLTASLAGRLDRRFSPRHVIAGGCLVAALGVAVLACLTPDTAFPVAAFGYVAAGAGFGALVPGITHAAMSDVPVSASGVGSAILNCSRQLGTATGLALIGALGSGVTTAWWRTVRPDAALAGDVTGGRLAVVQQALGPEAREMAASAFLAGYHAALARAAICLLLAGVLIAKACRPAIRPENRQAEAAERTPS
ncbi:MAG TPA: MFS transporter [Rhizobiaceae bacterium]|nr:MFS transporter [Rhizobiaceae bacterium]